MFESYYQLREQPFGVNPDPRFLYLSKTHREAFSSLLYRLQTDSGFLAMIAPPGMGKTTLLFHLLHRLHGTARTAFIFQTQCTSNDLLRNMLSEFECDSDTTDPVQMFRQLKSFLVTEANAGRRCVLIVDEAQNLGSEVLETIRLLSNFETPRKKLLNIILSGQAELGDMLSSIGLRQLRQRMSCIAYLQQFTPAETALYIAHRLEVAGFPGKVSDIFSIPALVRVAHVSQGVPRVINNMCFNALSLGYALDSKQIDLPIIDEVAADLGIASLHRSHPWQGEQSHPAEVKKPSLQVHDHHSEIANEIVSAVAARQQEKANCATDPLMDSGVLTADNHYDQAASPAGTSALKVGTAHLRPQIQEANAPAEKPECVLIQAAQQTPLGQEPSPIATSPDEPHRPRSRLLLRSLACILVLCVAPVSGVQLSDNITAPAPASPASESFGAKPIDNSAPASNGSMPSSSGSASLHVYPRKGGQLVRGRRKHHKSMPVDLSLATFTSEPLIKPLSVQPRTNPIGYRITRDQRSMTSASAAITQATPRREHATARYIPPQPIWQPAPTYKSAGPRRFAAKNVQLMLSISSQGDVYKADLLKGSGRLALAAERAARTWKYSPAISDGVPVNSQVYVTIQFQHH